MTRFLLVAIALALGLTAALPASAETRRERLERIRSEAPVSLQSWIEGLPDAQRRIATRRLLGMSDARRTRFFERWSGLSDAQREGFQRRMEEQAQASAGKGWQARREARRAAREERRERRSEAFAEKLRRWQSLSDADRSRMRRRLEHFQGLSADEQAALVDRHFASRSDAERATILERLRSAGAR